MKPKVLALCDYFLPGYKAGGPITTVSNMARQLADDLDFHVVARDRDLGDSSPYENLPVDEWHDVDGIPVYHVPSGRAGFASLRRLLTEADFDVLYLNSLLSPTFSIGPLLLRKRGLIPERPVVLAPRGELSPGALALKKWKKQSFLRLSRLLGLHRDVIWQASSFHERADIINCFGRKSRVVIAADLVSIEHHANSDASPTSSKQAGHLRLLFLSRIDAKKNLDAGLEMLRDVDGAVELDIVGPIDDSDYWARCQRTIDSLPANCRVRYHGSVKPAQVSKVMREHDLFYLPTLGENFGHVIPEALAAGCPVLISDRTPWRDLSDHGVGWDVPLERPDMFRHAIEQCIAMDDSQHSEFRRRARDFAIAQCCDGKLLTQNRDLFNIAYADKPIESETVDAAGSIA